MIINIYHITIFLTPVQIEKATVILCNHGAGFCNSEFHFKKVLMKTKSSAVITVSQSLQIPARPHSVHTQTLTCCRTCIRDLRPNYGKEKKSQQHVLYTRAVRKTKQNRWPFCSSAKVLSNDILLVVLASFVQKWHRDEDRLLGIGKAH